MDITIPLGAERMPLTIPLPSEAIVVAESRNPAGSGTWGEVVAATLKEEPLGARPIREEDLRGRKVAVITDDWGRPTPAYEAIPTILGELKAAGAADADITFVTASGMHDPMSREDLVRKLGAATVAKYRCISHDAGDRSILAFVGITQGGTPVWANRWVVGADYVVAMGRIHPHETHGYEGGYKMILPGVSGFDTIDRDHSMNFSPTSITGVVRGNPSREETDAVGRMVGIDFLVNVVMNAKSEPIKGFAGEPMQVFHRGVEYGDCNVWGAETGAPADIAVVSPGNGPVPDGYGLEVIWRAARVTKEGGTIICVAAREMPFDEPEGTAEADDGMLALGTEDLRKALRTLSFAEVVRLHDRRRWPLDDRAIQWRLKDTRGEYYRRRRVHEVIRRRIVITPDPGAALRDALATIGPSPRVVVIPEGRTTFPKLCLFRAEG